MKRSIFIFFFIGLTLCGLTLCVDKNKNQTVNNDDIKFPIDSKVLQDGLKVRLSPGIQSPEIGRLKKNESLTLFRRSVGSVKVGKLNAHWYHAKTDAGLTGWVYGAYLTIERPSDNGNSTTNTNNNKEKLEKQLTKKITGRWYGVTDTGKLKTFYLALFPKDSKFEAGWHNKISQKGKYKLTFEGQSVYVTLKVKHPMFKDIYGELIGQTFVMKANFRKEEWRFKITEKNPKSFTEMK